MKTSVLTPWMQPGGLRLGAAFTLLVSSLTGFAQTPAPDSTEIIKLPVFEVTADKSNRYQASEVSSGGRIRASIFDSPQTINVVTEELLKDVGAVRILDALKYVPGVTESTLPNGLDRLTVRGFQIDGATVDGFYDITQGNIDPLTIDRIEVVKGPNAILSPSGSPGGTVNNVSKKPLYDTPRSSVRFEYGAFDAGSVEIDSTGRLGDANSKFAYRILAAYRDFDNYYGNTTTKRYTIAPSLSYLFNPRTKLTLQAEYSDWEAGAYLGIPIDPSSGSTTQARLLSGVDPKKAVYADDIYRADQRATFRAFFTSELTDHLSVRVAARMATYELDNTGLNFAANNGNGGSTNPLTGLWVSGVVYGPGPTFTASPGPVQSRIFNRGGQRSTVTDKKVNFQNDWIYQQDFNGVKSTTGAGFAYTTRAPDGDQTTLNENLTNTPLDFDNIVLGPIVRTGVINTRENNNERTRQVYLNQNLTALDDRLILSLGYSKIYVNNSTIRLPRPPATLQPNVYIQNDEDTLNYGLVFKPVKNVSLFVGHAENASPVATNLSPAGTPDFSVGEQDEIGVRVRLLDNRLQLAATYFKIAQNAFSIPNPANLTVPAPIPPAPLLYSDREAKGWELEFTFEVAKGFTIIGNATDFTNRDPNNVPFRGTAEKSAAAWARYEFLTGELKGLHVSVGANYTAERPGTSASGLTAASTPTNLIPNLPTFYLGARTVIDLAFGYVRDDWSFQANIDNAGDQDYLLASLSRNAVYAAPGTNFRASATYRF